MKSLFTKKIISIIAIISVIAGMFAGCQEETSVSNEVNSKKANEIAVIYLELLNNQYCTKPYGSALA